MFRQSDVRVIGGVENMSGLACPHCSKKIELFPRVPEERSIWSSGVELLARIPLEPAVSASAEMGTPIVLHDPGSEVTAAFVELAAKLDMKA